MQTRTQTRTNTTQKRREIKDRVLEPRSEVQRHRVACVYFLNSKIGPKLVKGFAEACFRFTPQIALSGEKAVLLEIGGSAKLFSEDIFTLRLQALLRRFRISSNDARISIADDAVGALSMAKYRCCSRNDLPIEALREYLNPFAQRQNSGQEVRHRVDLMLPIFKNLGMEKLDDFFSIPKESLVPRIGIEAAQLIRNIQQAEAIPWPRFKPEEKVREFLDLDDIAELQSVMDLEPIVFLLKRLSDRIFARLLARRVRASVLKMSFALEKRSFLSRKQQVRDFRFELSVPQGSTHGLLPIIRDRLERELLAEPLEAPVQAISFEVLETIAAYGLQKDLFHKREEERESWNALVGRFCEKLGKRKVFLTLPIDRYLPEKNWRRTLDSKKVEEAEKNVKVDSIGCRPNRVFLQPEYLVKKKNLLKHVSSGRVWRVKKWLGPERMTGEWWNSHVFSQEPALGVQAQSIQPFDSNIGGRGFSIHGSLGTPSAREGDVQDHFFRDYYEVITSDGDRLWVFFSPSEAGFFLHGYFD